MLGFGPVSSFPIASFPTSGPVFSYLLSVGAQFNSGGSGVTSPVDTSAANFLVASVASFPSTPFVLSDNYGNTWVPLTAYVQADVQVQLYWCALPTVGAGHTFQVVGINTYASLCVAAFSGFARSSGPENGATRTASPLSPGSVTPSADNSLVVYALGSSFSSATVDIGTEVQQLSFIPHNSYAGALAYNIQTTAMAIAPTFTFSPYFPYAASSIAIFSPAVPNGGSSTNSSGVYSTGIIENLSFTIEENIAGLYATGRSGALFITEQEIDSVYSTGIIGSATTGIMGSATTGIIGVSSTITPGIIKPVESITDIYATGFVGSLSNSQNRSLFGVNATGHIALLYSELFVGQINREILTKNNTTNLLSGTLLREDLISDHGGILSNAQIGSVEREVVLTATSTLNISNILRETIFVTNNTLNASTILREVMEHRDAQLISGKIIRETLLASKPVDNPAFVLVVAS